MGLFLATIQAFAIMMGVSVGVLIITMAVTVFWVRRKVVNKVYGYFIEPNNQVTRELIPMSDGTGKVQSKDGGDYLIIPTKVKWSKWPPGLPTWAQETVPSLFFTRNNPEPFDPQMQKTIITAQSLKYITDEGMLKATWKDAHDAADEDKKIAGMTWMTWMAIGNFIIVVGLVVGMWFLYGTLSETSSQVKELLNTVRGLQ